MKKTRVSKLTLNRETVRNLEPERLGQAVGGRIFHRDETGGCGTGTGCNTYQCTFLCTDSTSGQNCA